jgi:hypothetical protein
MAHAGRCTQLMIPAESAHDTIGALGDVGLLQFKDLNADKSAFQRTYANQVRPQWCQEAVGGRLPAAWVSAGLGARTTNRAAREIITLPLRPLLLQTQVKRCDEMARKIRFFHDQVRRRTTRAAVGALGGAATATAAIRAKGVSLQRRGVVECEGEAPSQRCLCVLRQSPALHMPPSSHLLACAPHNARCPAVHAPPPPAAGEGGHDCGLARAGRQARQPG